MTNVGFLSYDQQCRSRRIQKRRDANDPGVLHEVPEEGGDQEPEASDLEEQAAGHQWHLSQVRNEGVQDREELATKERRRGEAPGLGQGLCSWPELVIGTLLLLGLFARLAATIGFVLLLSDAFCHPQPLEQWKPALIGGSATRKGEQLASVPEMRAGRGATTPSRQLF